MAAKDIQYGEAIPEEISKARTLFFSPFSTPTNPACCPSRPTSLTPPGAVHRPCAQTVRARSYNLMIDGFGER
jgi:hypothetical protein